MALTAEQVAQILTQAGWAGDDLVTMLAIGGRESRYNQFAHRTDNPDPNAQTGDFGLFQINSSNLTVLRNAGIINTMADLYDPLTSAKAALFIKNQSGWQPWAASAGGWSATGNHLYGTNIEAARQAATNVTGGSYVATPMSQTMPTGQFAIPQDAHLISVNGQGYAMFDVGGVHIAYKITESSGATHGPLTPVTQDMWNGYRAVDGGDASELAPVAQVYGSYRAFWDSIVTQVMGLNNPAKDDPDVKRVLAEFAGRPDMSPAELQNKLEATAWWRTRSTGELEWNGLADGEKQKRRDEMAARMADTWAQFTGEPITAGDPRIQNYVEAVASGKQGFGAWTEQVVKKAALEIENSPYQRQIADEAKAKKQPAIDKENTAMRIRQTLDEWGIQWSEGTIQDWARKIVDKDASDDDLLETLKDQAQIAYSWKPRDMSTKQAASPWLETYARVMEKAGTLTTVDIQKALTAGQPVWEFEQELKRSSGWLGTRNAREQLTTLAGSAGKLMGFS